MKTPCRFENLLEVFMELSCKVFQRSKMGSLHGTSWKTCLSFRKNLSFLECLECILNRHFYWPLFYWSPHYHLLKRPKQLNCNPCHSIVCFAYNNKCKSTVSHRNMPCHRNSWLGNLSLKLLLQLYTKEKFSNLSKSMMFVKYYCWVFR